MIKALYEGFFRLLGRRPARPGACLRSRSQGKLTVLPAVDLKGSWQDKQVLLVQVRLCLTQGGLFHCTRLQLSLVRLDADLQDQEMNITDF